MQEFKQVCGDAEQAKPFLLCGDTVYMHENIKPIEGGLYVYDEIQCTKDEYITLLTEKNEKQAEELRNAQSALAEVFELVTASE